MNPKSRHIINIDLLSQGEPTHQTVVVGGISFEVTRHSIGWDFDTAAALVEKFDGHVDAIAFSGVNTRCQIGKHELVHKASERLLCSVQKSSAYTATDIRRFFADWTLSRLLKSSPNLLRGKKMLFQAAILTPGVEAMHQAGANVYAADLLTMTGVPVRFHGLAKVERALGLLKPVLENAPPALVKPSGDARQPALQSRLRGWIQEADVFVTFNSMIDAIGTYDVLEGKTVVIDVLSEESEARLKAAKVGRILKLIPDLPSVNGMQLNSFSVLHAVVDQLRQLEDDTIDFDEYFLRFIESNELKPSGIEVIGSAVNRCAFIVHPLVRADLLRAPQLRWVTKTPESAQRVLEQALARVPAFHFGQIGGIRSKSTGQEVVCEIYGLPATPKQLLSMDERFIYDRLVATAEQARQAGCSIIGLGAYTKVVGDAGTTVARRAPIPVTNGNSYSAAATLWAAREIVEKMGFVRKPGNKIGGGTRLQAKAMVIGATGSIGRVSAHLLSLVFDQLVLVATRPGRLLELRDEIMAMAPGVQVHVTTDPNPDLSDCDLIVTATSNQGGRILDIDLVKPGAVICDCSRPLDISEEEAVRRPDVMVIESGEIDLPGQLRFTCDIGLPQPSVWACLAETVLLSMENKLESYSLGKELSLQRVKEIYKLGLKHGAQLSQVRGPSGFVTEDDIDRCRRLAEQRLKTWTRESAYARKRGVL